MDTDVKELAVLDPASIYKNPLDVLHDRTLSRKEKIELLRRWAYDEREKLVAEEENMIGLESDSVLDEVLHALHQLGVDSDQTLSPPTKQG